MRVQLAPELVGKVKKLDVRIRSRFKEVIKLFSKDPNNLELNNHKLRRERKGYSSINVTADWRAIYEIIYEIIDEEGEDIAYFVELGTHKQLYRKSKAD